MSWDATVFDGPTLVVHKLEDIVVPLRSQNLQPVTPENPFGAAWVARLIKVNLDMVKRRMEDKTYDLLDEDDFNTLKGNFRTRSYEDKIYQEDRITREKEQQAGLMTDWADLGEIDKWITVIEWYGRWDVNGDGLGRCHLLDYARWRKDAAGTLPHGRVSGFTAEAALCRGAFYSRGRCDLWDWLAGIDGGDA
jgi:hypothetical protein